MIEFPTLLHRASYGKAQKAFPLFLYGKTQTDFGAKVFVSDRALFGETLKASPLGNLGCEAPSDSYTI